jgi:Uma2 family endonuclease
MTAVLSVPPPAVAAGPEPYRFSVAQYHTMVAAGVFRPDDRIELIRGIVVKKMTKHSPHILAGKKVRRAIEGVLPVGWHAQTQDPIVLPEGEPEPDLSVIRGEMEDYATRKPTAADVGLVVEVSDSSLAADRGEKLRGYAEGGVQLYWIVNLVDGQLEVHTDPRGDVYTTVTTLRPGEQVTLTLDGTALVPIPVRDLLP